MTHPLQSRRRGRPKLRWEDDMLQDIRLLGVKAGRIKPHIEKSGGMFWGRPRLTPGCRVIYDDDDDDIVWSVAKGDWDFQIPDLVKNPYGTDIEPLGEFQWSPEGPVSQIHSPHPHVGAPGNFLDLLRSVQMLKREWGAESNGKLPHLFNPW